MAPTIPFRNPSPFPLALHFNRFIRLMRRLSEQPGDVRRTFASIDKARANLGYAPKVSIEDGIRDFVAWMKSRPR